MPTNLYEIIQLPNGDYALQRTDGSGEPLVKIRFSKEAKHFLRDSSVDVARAMIDAGIEVVEQMAESDTGSENQILDDGKPRTLH